MSKRKVKLNGVWIDVDEKDIKDPEDEKDDKDNKDDKDDKEPENGDENLNDDDKKSIEAEAKKMGKDIAKQILGDIGIDNDAVDKLSKKVDKVLDLTQPKNSKLVKILNGKDYIKDANELTKEEKIVGFWHALVTNNEVALRALSEGTNADGGFLFPNEFYTELIKEIPNINVMRQYVRVIPMRRNVMDITNLVSGPKVTWTDENVAKSTTTARFSRLTLTAFKVAAILYSSDELIEDSDIFDVVQMIINQFAEAIADEEERVIWVGNGTTQPQGIDSAGTIGTVAAVNQDFDDLITLHYQLPRKYRRNAAFFANDATIANIRKLKDSNNNYIWVNHSPTANVTGSPGSILGKPVISSDWVPDNTIFFGDMKIAYFLGDRKRMAVKISQDTTEAFTKDETAIRVVSRLGGQVVQPLAARELTGF